MRTNDKLTTSMLDFTRESILEAINKIDTNLDIIKGRESTNYDLVLEDGRKYPPILVLSEAQKLLGGVELTLSSFGNSTVKPFSILNKLGFKVLPKEPNKDINEEKLGSETFNYRQFLTACNAANLFISEQLALRFISSLITKPFVILTGLSGSGKTKLALAFAKWLTGEGYKTLGKNIFTPGQEIKSSRVTYSVAASDSVAVTFSQKDTGTKATLPYELIFEWVEIIKKNNFTEDTPARRIRETVEQATKYSSQLNSFETHLKAAALHVIQTASQQADQTPAICLVPVGADWTNRDPLLGYASALDAQKYMKPENGALQLIIDAKNNPHKPFFLILDEMNLSHVERYFADFLSAMESKEAISLHAEETDVNGVPPFISLPDNLFIIGTVNIDETTYMFSPKVLDRANVIEFRVEEEEMKRFLSKNTTINMSALTGKGASTAADFLNKVRAKDQTLPVNNEVTNDLIEFFKELKKAGAEFGYRTATEILRFAAVVNTLESEWSKEEILDAAIMQKLLPKVHGSRRKLEPVLKSLAELCLRDKAQIADVLNPKKDISFHERDKYKYPVSLEKIRRMYTGLINNGFTSYAEA